MSVGNDAGYGAGGGEADIGSWLPSTNRQMLRAPPIRHHRWLLDYRVLHLPERPRHLLILPIMAFLSYWLNLDLTYCIPSRLLAFQPLRYVSFERVEVPAVSLA